MVLYLSIPFPVERSPTTYSLSFSTSNLSRGGSSDVEPSIPSSLPAALLTTLSSNPLSSRPQSSTSGTSSSSSSGSGSTSSFPEQGTSSTGSRSHTEVFSTFQAPTSSQPFPVSTEALSSGTTSGPMVSQASVYPSDVGNGYLQEAITPTPVSLTSPSLSSPSSTSSEPTVTIVRSNSMSSTSSITSVPSVAYSFSSSHTASMSSLLTSSIMTSSIIPSTSTFVVSTTKVDESSSAVVIPPQTSTLILTSVLPNSYTTAWTTTTSGVLSTVGVANTVNKLSRSPGSVIGIALGILGAFAFAVLWLFCARRRQRQLSRDASAIPPWTPGGPLEAEIDMEEPYAGILAALDAGMGAGRDAHIEGDTSGEVSGELAIPYTSSPTLPLLGEGHNGGLFAFPLSPPPSTQVSPPPSAYTPPTSSKGPRRRSSPGPDASAWFGGYHIAPAASVISHHSYSTSNALTRTETGTRTRTGSEEPLLKRAGSASSYLDYGNKIRLGSAFGSPKDNTNGRDLSPTSFSSGKRSNTVSSFGALGSVSSQGALRSASSHGYDFGFGSTSSGAGSHMGPALGLAISGVQTSYTNRHPIKWKKGKRESTGSSMSVMSASALGSADEKPAGVRAFLDRIRLRNTPSPKSESSGDIESEGASEKRNTDASRPHTSPRFSAVLLPSTPSPEPVHVPTSPRFVLSNPDPQSHLPYVRVEAEGVLQGHEGGLRPPAWPWGGHKHVNSLPPSPVLTLESRITTAEGLLDPRLCETIEGRSNASLRDFEDYSRPIGGLVNNRMNSTTTFDTVDSLEGTSIRIREDDLQEDIHSRVITTPHASWAMDVNDNDFHAY